ncbi:10679_t:CDS:2 [Paraglomus occultum]|uniref:10679_t:CDS:1 n=1 Tax=Paraglomus occultum TaxID=144539 RepID=A0A9N8ZK67_9GLOM|nr:10679_t:CDS:2 [Paraglomus occultum]
MDVDELAQYQNQLDKVDNALQSDPENIELLKLKQDLTELINLTSDLIDAAEPNSPKKSPSNTTSPKSQSLSSPTTPTSATSSIPVFTRPIQVGDTCLARWSGDGQFYPATVTAIGGGDQVFSVVFKGYNNVELVNVQDIKPKEQRVVKQKQWLAFAHSAAAAPGRRTNKAKRLVQPPINKKSIFATPENPEGKVGVVGSGRPMTQFQQRANVDEWGFIIT